VADISWPKKTREMHNHHFNSSIWNDFRFRDDDIIIATYGKSGTTWLQQIVAQLLFNGAENLPVMELSPWLDLRFPPADVKLAEIEAQTHRRFIKTHLPVDALVYSPLAKYLYVGRDGRDVLWSLHHHHISGNEFFYETINDAPGRVGPPLGRPLESVRDYFLAWLEQDGYPLWSFWDNVRGWWDIRNLPNLMLLHYNQLKADLPGEIRRIAAFLDIAIDESRFPLIVGHCQFDYMKANAARVTGERMEKIFDGGAKSFINKGTNGRWQSVLTKDDCARYETLAKQKLGPECAAWLAQAPS
jgi:aryl sulfotransferase